MSERRVAFAPVATPTARVLILGSMPGVASLDAVAYYAHPRNAFWTMMARLLGFDVTAPYAERLAALQDAGIALWDVLAACVRPGSLDADIEQSSIEINDFEAFFATHPSIQRILLNGGAAFDLYRRHVLPTLGRGPAALARQRLPSTSPAYAAMPATEKYRHWHAALAPYVGPTKNNNGTD